MSNRFSHFGVRVMVINKEGKLLMVKHKHKACEPFWVLPGGGLEENEYSWDAAVREVKEETNMDVKVISLMYILEEKTEFGLRCTNYFLAEIIGGDLCLGSDPEFTEENQVLKDVKFFSKEELKDLDRIYPEIIRDEFWDNINGYLPQHKIWRKRPSEGFSKK